MPDALPVPPRPRERILPAARDLFHRNGIRGVGVDAIAEAAGTNKMTLYRHFDSKDDLIVAYLRGVAAEAETMWQDIAREHPGDMEAQLRSWLARAAECVVADDRGCDLANAAGELTEEGPPGRRLIGELKTDQRNRLAAGRGQQGAQHEIHPDRRDRDRVVQAAASREAKARSTQTLHLTGS